MKIKKEKKNKFNTNNNEKKVKRIVFDVTRPKLTQHHIE